MGNKTSQHTFAPRADDVITNPLSETTSAPLFEPSRYGAFKASSLPGHDATGRAMSAVEPQAAAAPAHAAHPDGRTVFLTKGSQGFGFVFSTNTKAYHRGINHYISDVSPGGEADLAGLRVGDRILAIEATNTINLPHAKVIQLLQQLAPNKTVCLTITAPNALIRASISAASGASRGSADAAGTTNPVLAAAAAAAARYSRGSSSSITGGAASNNSGFGSAAAAAAPVAKPRALRASGQIDDEDSNNDVFDSIHTAMPGPRHQCLAASLLPRADDTIEVSGRRGVFAYVNGLYTRLRDDAHGHPVYRHCDALPAKFGPHAGESVHLYYHAVNGAWALGVEVGGDVVIGFCVSHARSPLATTGWVFEPDRPAAGGPVTVDDPAFVISRHAQLPAGLVGRPGEVYPLSPNVARCSIANADWASDDKGYKPLVFTMPEILAAAAAGDPNIDPDLPSSSSSSSGCTLAFNTKEGGVNRISHDGDYSVQNGLPRNPLGRSGLDGRGCLTKFGPNHVVVPLITRWLRDDAGDRILSQGKPTLEVLALKCNTGLVLPEVVLLDGETQKVCLKRRFFQWFKTDLSSSLELEANVTRIFDQGREVFKGILLDDPRRTDSAWVEVVATLLHDDDRWFSAFPLPEALRWATVDVDFTMPIAHYRFVASAVSLTNAANFDSVHAGSASRIVSVHL